MEHTHAEHQMHSDSKRHKVHQSSYKNLLWMMLLSFISMYILMYAMVDKFANVVPNVNQFYMAGLMSSPMLIIELLLMRKMYSNKKLNTILLSVGVAALLCFYFAIRKQAAVGDKQFLKSMIPHHAAAILMVEQTDLSDPEIKKLGADIIAAQQKEIEFMKAKIKALERKY